MSKEIKSLDELLEEKANRAPAELRAPQKKGSFLEGAIKSIKEHNTAKAAIRKAERERIEKERKEAAERAERERPVRLYLDIAKLNESNIIQVIKQNTDERPIDLIIDIGSYKLVYDVAVVYGGQDKNNTKALASKADAILTAFDKKYGTQHQIKENTHTEEREEERFADAKYDYERYFTTIKYETGEIYAVLSVGLAQKEEILKKATLK